jgi:hypothetical protein
MHSQIFFSRHFLFLIIVKLANSKALFQRAPPPHPSEIVPLDKVRESVNFLPKNKTIYQHTNYRIWNLLIHTAYNPYNAEQLFP